MTLAPPSRNASVTARPNPPVPPATRAIFPSNFALMSIASICLSVDNGDHRFQSTGKVSSPASSDTLLTALFDQFCYQTGPAGLMAGANPAPIITVEIFVEENEIAPVRIALKKFRAAGYRTAAVRIAKENVNEPPGNFRRHLPEIGFGAGMRGALDFKIFTVVVVEFLQGFHEQIVHGKPDGPAPVGISAKEACRGFSGFVVNAVGVSVHLNLVRMVLMEARESTHSVGRKKFRFVQHAAEDALELFAIHQGKKPADAARGTLRHFDVLGHVGMIVTEPLHAALEAGETIDDFRLESLDREKRNQSDHRPDFQKVSFAVGKLKHAKKKPSASSHSDIPPAPKSF